MGNLGCWEKRRGKAGFAWLLFGDFCNDIFGGVCYVVSSLKKNMFSFFFYSVSSFFLFFLMVFLGFSSCFLFSSVCFASIGFAVFVVPATGFQ